MTAPLPTILVFDSGVGGLTVLDPIRSARPDARFVYVGDTAFFPYGERDEGELIARVVSVIDDAVRRFKPDLIVIACHTASTLVLPALRAQLSIPIIGSAGSGQRCSNGPKYGSASATARPCCGCSKRTTVLAAFTKRLVGHRTEEPRRTSALAFRPGSCVTASG